MHADQNSIIDVFQIIILVLLWLPVCYIFVFAMAGLFYRERPYAEAKKIRKMAVLIPGYKEDAVILEAAENALIQNYQQDRFDVIVIADSFQQKTLETLRAMPIRLIEVSFEKSTKSKALNVAMAQLNDEYDIAVILDADNIMAPDFLLKLNAVFEHNYIAVQGHRTAKNMNTSLAVLDAISEEINNHIFRKGHRVLRLSSAIIGSGMAFHFAFFRDLMKTVKAVGGFDKEIELKLLKEGHKIAYRDDALVFDEKVQKPEVFSNQRRRWLSAQYHYFRNYFPDALKDLILKGNIDYFDKAIQFVQPPRILLLAAVLLVGFSFLLFNLIVQNPWFFLFAWSLLIVACLLAFLFSVPRKFYNVKTLKALLSLPNGMFLMLRSLLKIKGANKHFIHTQHGTDSNKK